MVSAFLCVPVCAGGEGRGAFGVSCYSILSYVSLRQSLSLNLVTIGPQRFLCGSPQPYDYGVTMLSIFTCVLGI